MSRSIFEYIDFFYAVIQSAKLLENKNGAFIPFVVRIDLIKLK